MQSVLIVNAVATTYDLTTLATVKTELGLTTTDEDIQLAAWISQASNACASYCDRVFGQETVTETFRNRLRNWDDRRHIESIELKRIPIATINSIVEDGTPLVVDVDYELDPYEGLIYRLDANDRLRHWRFAKLVVNYAGAYVLVGNLPHNIERACITQVKNIRSGSNRDPNVKQESIPGVLETSYFVGTAGDNGALPPEVTALLDPYRNISV